MSRYYEISVGSNSTGFIGSSSGPPTAGGAPIIGSLFYSSYPNGQNDPGALNVQLDLLSGAMDTPVGNCTITVEGVSMADIQQAVQYSGSQIIVKGGMKPGLPLANTMVNKSGLLLQGQILQSWGNWIGSDMNINFVVVPSQFTFQNPGNIVLAWQPGQSLQAALTTTLSNAGFPAASFSIGSYINSTGVMLGGQYHTLTNLGQWVEQYTRKNFPGKNAVHIAVLPNGSIFVFDGSVSANEVQIEFTDLIGQPRWVDQGVMQFMSVMRSDILVGTHLRMPKGLQGAPGFVTTGQSAYPGPLKYQSAFQGAFVVQSVRHIGNFRDPDGSSWASVFQVAVTSPAQVT